MTQGHENSNLELISHKNSKNMFFNQSQSHIYITFSNYILFLPNFSRSIKFFFHQKNWNKQKSWAALQNFNSWATKLTVTYTKKTIWHLAIWQNWCFGQELMFCKVAQFFFVTVFLSRKRFEGAREFLFQKVWAYFNITWNQSLYCQIVRHFMYFL